jgi:hypothetical protein
VEGGTTECVCDESRKTTQSTKILLFNLPRGKISSNWNSELVATTLLSLSSTFDSRQAADEKSYILAEHSRRWQYDTYMSDWQI